MYELMIVVFVVGYAFITIEHTVKVDKAAIALITGVLCWTIYVFGKEDIVQLDKVKDYAQTEFSNIYPDEIVQTSETIEKTPIEIIQHYVTEVQLFEILSEISSILFFLMGAMTIVEIIDLHGGFRVVTDRIKTTSKLKLFWILGFVSFFFSALLDNLTTSIIMVSLTRKFIVDQKDRWFFLGMIIIAANAGGAWSPIGDVTTTMLWIGKQITTYEVVTKLIMPSLVCLIVPLIIMSPKVKGTFKRPDTDLMETSHHTTNKQRNLVFFSGVAGLLFVPFFKSVTHYPPFMGMMLSLGFLWLLTDILHRKDNTEDRRYFSAYHALEKMDVPTLLFFLGILLAVGSLQAAGQLGQMAIFLDNEIGTDTNNGVYLIGLIIGLLSAIVDNVPLVAAAIGMYPLDGSGFFQQDGLFWQFLAYCAGTGGSALIIGSAAGVAIMGLEKIPFFWYMKKITIYAVVGYFCGAAAYVLQNMLLN
ncbi:MAG: sodium:proton antiporter NhaD [Flammeovirgaceae bacterium]|jgi:Na+/H+ antiporter NhaD/arsenite permease-like protein